MDVVNNGPVSGDDSIEPHGLVDQTQVAANRCADRGDRILKTYMRRHGQGLSVDEVLADILTDLRHATERLDDDDVDLDSAIARSAIHFHAEHPILYGSDSSLYGGNEQSLT